MTSYRYSGQEDHCPRITPFLFYRLWRECVHLPHTTVVRLHANQVGIVIFIPKIVGAIVIFVHPCSSSCKMRKTQPRSALKRFHYNAEPIYFTPYLWIKKALMTLKLTQILAKILLIPLDSTQLNSISSMRCPLGESWVGILKYKKVRTAAHTPHHL